MHNMCRSTKKTSEKASTGPQKSQNDRLFATSPCHEDFQRLKLASFDKLQVPLHLGLWLTQHEMPHIASTVFFSVWFTNPLNVFSDCLEHVAARNYVWCAEMWMMRTTYLNNSSWVELLLKSFKILQNHAIPKEHIMHIMDHKLSVVFGLVFQAMSGSVKNVRMYGVSGVKSNTVTVARDAA